ncbi:MAG TPA: hypothetical protein VK427_26540 [Kofleriaceae bacterium]|nr:hypothetical protein [Kofleriaceae bacterium]
MVRLASVALLTLVVACARERGPIGETTWSIPGFVLHGRVASTGETLVLHEMGVGARLGVVSRAGELRWEASYAREPLISTIAQNGDVYVLVDTLSALVLERRARVDGTTLWSKTLPRADARFGALVLDREDVVWLVFNDDGPTDLGGGPFGEPRAFTARYGRFAASDGAYLSSGVLPFVMTEPERAASVPTGGIVVSTVGPLAVIDRDGRPRFTPNRTRGFAMHEDGTISAASCIGRRCGIVRFDANLVAQRVLDVPCGGAVTPLLGGAFVVAGSASLGEQGNVIGCIAHVDAGDAVELETLDAVFLDLLPGDPYAGYRMRHDGTLVARELP